MKSFSIPLIVVMSALALPQSAYGNEQNVPNATSDGNQAEALLTQPASINTKWRNFSGQTFNLRPTSQSISGVQDQECAKINPLEILNNPESFFKECPQLTNARRNQNYEPVEYFKVPKLDSGIKLTVTQF
ncbi:hypothetical protein VF14_01280 [Nostoc linckia z18]|jgi:hypothetical protein|uniref:Uncharacterized protein n=2 Tax=Nostoc linckia TaxID=92942 RepID=A0A9Q5ZGV7_NOSLI|nr:MULTISPECIES: hypothetical protein [Nostoc]PHK36498.1 hypothetical protein VF12_21270 [Nostoc linckia z15]PHK45254.1 hypothetical protein VF13_17315 [Nostoc linckia z16]MBC1239533.1 hypothetical protein [Nostoc sp. 2RC]PHJ67927.1 hypothetical protein VF02_04035 [Nostoc linckia z1]PHJ72865.1 hypothetical protein VF05_02955 [Nostoc linckia z3]